MFGNLLKFSETLSEPAEECSGSFESVRKRVKMFRNTSCTTRYCSRLGPEALPMMSINVLMCIIYAETTQKRRCICKTRIFAGSCTRTRRERSGYHT